MHPTNMKVGTRLALGYALVLGLLAIIVGFGQLKMKEMQQHLKLITDVNNVEIALIGTMQESVSDRMIGLRNLAILTVEDVYKPNKYVDGCAILKSSSH